MKACTHAKQNKTQLQDIRNKLSDIEKLKKKEKTKRKIYKFPARDKKKEEEQNLATQKKLLFLMAMLYRQIKIKQLLSSY